MQKTSECAEEVAEGYVEAEHDNGACRGREHAKAKHGEGHAKQVASYIFTHLDCTSHNSGPLGSRYGQCISNRNALSSVDGSPIGGDAAAVALLFLSNYHYFED